MVFYLWPTRGHQHALCYLRWFSNLFRQECRQRVKPFLLRLARGQLQLWILRANGVGQFFQRWLWRQTPLLYLRIAHEINPAKIRRHSRQLFLEKHGSHPNLACTFQAISARNQRPTCLANIPPSNNLARTPTACLAATLAAQTPTLFVQRK